MQPPKLATHFALWGLASFLLFVGSPCWSADTHTSTNTAPQIGERLLLLSAGESGTAGIVSYGLYCAVSGARAASNNTVGGDLVLVLRNNGAKWIALDDVTAEDFSLLDSQGSGVKLYLRSSPKGVAYGASEVIHLIVDHAANAPQPWALRFKSKPKAHVPIDLSITGIEPKRVASSRREQ